MKISIITVVYNGEKHLEQTIQSILNQTYQNIEYIIIDGGSTDKTLNIIKKYEHAIDYWISEPDCGIYDAMNKGILQATGDIIGILNADDWYEEETIQTVINHFDTNTDILTGLCLNWNKGKSFLNQNDSINQLNQRMCINHPATFIRKQIYNEIGLFSPHYRISGDYNFITRCYLAGKSFKFIDKVLTNFRESGISRQHRLISFIENLKAQEELGINNTFQNLLYFNFKMISFIFKRWLRSIK